MESDEFELVFKNGLPTEKKLSDEELLEMDFDRLTDTDAILDSLKQQLEQEPQELISTSPTKPSSAVHQSSESSFIPSDKRNDHRPSSILLQETCRGFLVEWKEKAIFVQNRPKQI